MISRASVTQSTADIQDGDDGPLLLTLLLTNRNANNAANQQPAGNDTLDPRGFALELKTVELDLSTIEQHSRLEEIDSQSVPDTLVGSKVAQELNPRTVLQLRGSLDQEHSGQLSKEQLQFWTDYGYLVIPDALSKSTAASLHRNVETIAETLATGDNRVVKHSYLPGQSSFVSPVGRVIATLTENASTPGVEPLQRIQRLGCGIHRAMQPFRKIVMSKFHEEISTSLGYLDPRVIQSLVIVKAAEVGARVVPHQDGCSGFTDPPSCTTFWYALEDATVENGCLAVVPGSHRAEPIARRCRKDHTGKPEFVDLEHPIFAKVENASNTAPTKDENEHPMYKKLEVKAGTLIFMHGNLMHMSEANRSKKSRVAFNFGIVDGGHEWLSDNYLQPYEGHSEFERLES